jgi:hypothetical protein
LAQKQCRSKVGTRGLLMKRSIVREGHRSGIGDRPNAPFTLAFGIPKQAGRYAILGDIVVNGREEQPIVVLVSKFHDLCDNIA